MIAPAITAQMAVCASLMVCRGVSIIRLLAGSTDHANGITGSCISSKTLS